MQGYVARGGIPSKDLLHSGTFASHFFDINPDLDPIPDGLVLKPFSSRFTNPIDGKEERILVLGVTSSEDGQYRRQKTDFFLVLDRSGSMGESLLNIPMPRKTTMDDSGNENQGLRTKMMLGIEAAKGIFDLVEDDEEIGIATFDTKVDIIEEVKPKGAIDRETLFQRLNEISPRGGTDCGLGLSAAFTRLQAATHQDRNQRIFFLTDACLTAGASTNAIREMTETAFQASNGRLGVTYWGIGLSFDAAVCAELTRAHSASISSINNYAELYHILHAEFNYQVSPPAFDIHIGISSSDYVIAEVYGGDSDCREGDSLLEFRTYTASEAGAEGVKGSVLIIYLNPLGQAVGDRTSISISIDWTRSGGGDREHRSSDYFLNDEPLSVTEKAYALSTYYRTVRAMLPEKGERKIAFTGEDAAKLRILEGFLKNQRPDLTVQLAKEIKIVEDLIAKHCETDPTTTS
jgi:hypothetical protein